VAIAQYQISSYCIAHRGKWHPKSNEYPGEFEAIFAAVSGINQGSCRSDIIKNRDKKQFHALCISVSQELFVTVQAMKHMSYLPLLEQVAGSEAVPFLVLFLLLVLTVSF
jgi:hypothetical protein